MPNEIRCTWGEVERAYCHFYNRGMPKGLNHCEALQQLCVIYGWEVIEQWLVDNRLAKELSVSVFRSDIDAILEDDSKFKAIEWKVLNVQTKD